MKRLLTLLITTILLFTAAAPLNGRTIGRLYQSDFALSYGQVSFPQTVYVMGEVLGVAFSLGHFAPQNTVFVGQIGLEYTNWVGNNIGVGAFVSADYMTSVVNGGEQANYTMFVVSLMPTLKASWFNYENVGMYSKIGVGISDFINESREQQIVPAFQVSPICVDFGWYNFRAFIEIGYGAQGICGGLKFTI